VRKLLIGLACLAVVLTGVMVAEADSVRQPSAGDSRAVIWLSPGVTRAQAGQIRDACSHIAGVSPAGGLARSTSAPTAGELMYSLDTRWGPDVIRRNPLLSCLRHDRGVDHYVIPI
jgi:hypothetical protein